MKVLLIGSGAREHALAHALVRGGAAVHAAPGNPGIARLSACHPLKGEDVAGMAALARELKPDLAVVGPEAPLVAGVADALRAEGLKVFGPSAAAAKLEGSKAFAKKVMEEAGVATASWAEFDDADRAEAHAAALGRAVVKADGLAAGKGVIVANGADAARQAVRALMRGGAVGQAGRRVVIEEGLEGEEGSAIAICDGGGGGGGGGERHRDGGGGALPHVPVPPGSQAPARRRSGAEHRRHGRHLPGAGAGRRSARGGRPHGDRPGALAN